MNFKFNFALLSLMAASVTMAGGWDVDHTRALAREIRDSIDTDGANQIAGYTFYARGQIRIVKGPGLGGGLCKVTPDPDSSNFDAEFLGNGSASGTVTIETPKASINIWGNSDPSPQLSEVRTRIVHGVVLGCAEISSYDDIPSNDPWKSRFPVGIHDRIRWVEFPSNDLKWRYKNPLQTSSSPPENISVKEDSFGTTDLKNFPTATFNGHPLRFAEACLGGNSLDENYRWIRALPPATGTQPLNLRGKIGNFHDPNLDADQTLQFPATSQVSDTNQWMMAFHSIEAESSLTPVSSWSITEHTSPTTPDYLNVTLAASPWTSGTPGYQTQDWAKNQRFTLLNAPEFLTKDYTMVINFTTRRMFFLVPEGTEACAIPTNFFSGQGEDTTGVGADIGADDALEISLPRGTNTGNPAIATANFDCPLAITGDNYTGVSIRDIAFSTGRTMMVRMQDTTGGGSEFLRCKFRNLGHNGVSMLRCAGVDINTCAFEDGYRGHLKVDAGFDFRTRNWLSDFASPLGRTLAEARLNQITNLDNDSIVVHHSAFRRGGLLWPRVSAIYLDRFNYATEIGPSNAFEHLSAKGVWISGIANRVFSNTFTDCLRDVSDDGCVYMGNSFIQIGNEVTNNYFVDMKLGGRADQILYPNSLEDDVAGVMLDDYACGAYVGWNSFENSRMGIMSNGGRFNMFERNYFTNVWQPMGTIVPAAASENFYSWYPDFAPSDVYRRSKLNQAYAEFRNVCELGPKDTNGKPKIFGEGIWSSLQSDHAYSNSYRLVDHDPGDRLTIANDPIPTIVNEPSSPSCNDLVQLQQKLNEESGWFAVPAALPLRTALPSTWVDSRGSVMEIISVGAAPLCVPTFGTPWFSNKTDANPFNFNVNRPFVATDFEQPRMLNYRNIIIWNDTDFPDGVPAWLPNQANGSAYIINQEKYPSVTYDAFQRQNTTARTDPYGYNARYVPLGTGE